MNVILYVSGFCRSFKQSYILYLFRFVNFWERAAHSADRMLFLFCLFVILVISRFGFEGCIWVLIASVPVLCILFSIQNKP